MILHNDEYGNFDIGLINDGTMDTVVEVFPLSDYVIGKVGMQEIRFTLDDDGFYRDEDGCMTDEGFKDLAEQALEGYIERYLID